MRASFVILCIGLLFLSPRFAAAQTFKYTDKNGVVNFTDDRESIPAEYRKSAVVVKDEAEKKPIEPVKIEAVPQPSAAAAPPATAAPQGAADRLLALVGDSALATRAGIIAALVLIFIFAGWLLRSVENKRIITLVRCAVVLLVIVIAFQAYLEKAANQMHELKNQAEAFKKQAEKRGVKADQIPK